MLQTTTITLFNYYAPVGAWYTTVFAKAYVGATASASVAAGNSKTNADSVIILINSGLQLSATKQYAGPKEYAASATPEALFTFAPEQDFIVTGDHSAASPIADDDYDEGLYHHLNDSMDGVYMITSAEYFALIPHFEIGGR